MENMETVSESEVLGSLIIVFLVIAIVVIVVALVIYIITSIFMNNLHKKIYGKGTALAWIPYARTYLLGKLAVNKLIGWIYLGVSLVSTMTVSTGREGETSTLIPGLSGLVSVATLTLYIMAIIKNGKLKRGEITPEAAKAECESTNFKKTENSTSPTPENVVNAIPQIENNTPPAPTPTPTAKYCVNCGAEIIEGSAFCIKCGNKN